MGTILIEQKNSGDAGYFRIGNVILDIPPDQIQCHKVINNQEVMPLRFPFAMPVKTGQSRWDVTWSWKAIADFNSGSYSSWQDVQMLLAMFKSAPFVEVENEHIRQLINPAQLNNGATADDAMAFALRQMRVETVPDMADVLQITMTMSLFNYRPYSHNFQYDDGTGNPASSALASLSFTSYLQQWIANNLTSDPTVQDSTPVSSPDWIDQTPGSLTLSWREYRGVALPQPNNPAAGATTPAPANPYGNTTAGTADQAVEAGFPANVTINPVDPTNPDIQYWVTATAVPESGGNYNAVNHSTVTNSGAPSAAVGLLQWVRAAAIDSMKESDSVLGTNYISTATQNGFLTSSTGGSGSTWASKTVSNPQSSDPVLASYISWMTNPPIAGGAPQLQNDMATGWAILKLKANSGNVMDAWIAHRFGQGDVKSNPPQDNKWFSKAVQSWRGNPGHAQDFYPTPNSTPAAQPQAPTPTTTVTSGTNTNTQSNTSGSSTVPGQVPMTPQIQTLINEGWVYDYTTESAAFLYKTHNIHMTDQEHGDVPSSTDIEDIDPQNFVNPMQISVIFLNNIAQIPLASYQYPAYQHLGPVSTMVSIGLLSTAFLEPATDDYSEPEHDGLSLIADMSNMMEDQFQRLRTEWRRVNSIQRMQAIAVKNQVLNLLGIRGLLTKEFTTETVPDAANLVNAQYNAVQYENVFESSTPFSVATVPAQFGPQWLTILRNGTLNQFANNGSVTALVNLSNLMQNPNSADSQQFLFQWLTQSSNVPAQAYIVPTPAAFTGDQQAFLLKVMSENGANASAIAMAAPGAVLGDSFAALYTDIANKIKQHSQLNYSDYFLIKNGTPSSIPDFDALVSLEQTIDQSIAQALANNPSFEPPINQLFDLYVAYAVSNNVLNIASEMVIIQKTPQVQPSFTTPGGQTTPGSADANQDHGCYQDMGIQTITLGGKDYTPAVYFYDDNQAMSTQLSQQTQQIAQTTVTTAQSFANATPLVKDKFTVSTQSFDQNGIQSLLSTVHPSAYTMRKAFPTFKLFLMEDMSNKPFFAYDNFYSYATVLDMEIIRYRDRPDAAVIQVSDLMHLLDQHLYDSTPQGKFEQALQAPFQTTLPTDDALTGPQGAPGGVVYDVGNQFTEINPAGGDHTFPLKYFPLQTGTKIQVRMGFSNNPDLLIPVFTGQVTEIEGDEVLKITAQSYMLELVTPTSDDIRTDGFAVDSFINNTSNAIFKSVRDVENGNLLNVPSSLLSIFGTAPAYGGGGDVGGIRIPGILTTAGGAIDVISAMLKVSSAKHFGFWQPGAPTDPYLKGYNWQNAVASALLLAGNSALTKGATGLEAGYDRSYENVLISHVFGPDGTATTDGKGSVRGWWFEKTAGYGAPYYHVPKDSNLTPWTLIQDIARRYPEFILAVKQYGFPYTADATLVFANPHDFYSSRSPMPGDIETQQTSTNPNLFFQWWTSGANSGRAQFQSYCNTIGGQWANVVLKQYDQSINYTGDSAVSTLGQVGTFLGQLNPFTGEGGANLRSITAGQLTNHIDSGGAGTFSNIVDIFVQVIGSATSQILYSSASTLNIGQQVTTNTAQQALEQIVQNYNTYVQQQTTGTTATTLSDRMKPVRRYHMINGDNIVHNGIMMNEKFYNTVKILNQNILANAAIPSQYCRVLNVDPYMVDKKNIEGNPQFTNAYAQTFLRDEVAKLYRGELVLMGNPEIEPYDVLVMMDPSTGITGPIEVDSVIHSFNMETGYITIVKPRAFVIINDALSAPLYSAVWSMLIDVQGQIEGYASKLNINAPGAELGLGVAAVAGGIAVGPWIAGAAALAGTMALFWAGKEVQQMNPLGVIPLTRFTRPWVGGLEGWRIDDIMTLIATKWSYFKIEEVEPLIYSFRVARGMQLI